MLIFQAINRILKINKNAVLNRKINSRQLWQSEKRNVIPREMDLPRSQMWRLREQGCWGREGHRNGNCTTMPVSLWSSRGRQYVTIISITGIDGLWGGYSNVNHQFYTLIPQFKMSTLFANSWCFIKAYFRLHLVLATQKFHVLIRVMKGDKSHLCASKHG